MRRIEEASNVSARSPWHCHGNGRCKSIARVGWADAADFLRAGPVAVTKPSRFLSHGYDAAQHPVRQRAGQVPIWQAPWHDRGARPWSAPRPSPCGNISYRLAYEATFMIQGNAVRERRRSGVSAFHASQQASTTAS